MPGRKSNAAKKNIEMIIRAEDAKFEVQRSKNGEYPVEYHYNGSTELWSLFKWKEGDEDPNDGAYEPTHLIVTTEQHKLVQEGILEGNTKIIEGNNNKSIQLSADQKRTRDMNTHTHTLTDAH